MDELAALKARALDLAPQIASAAGISEQEVHERLRHATDSAALREVIDAAEERASWESVIKDLADG